MTKRKFIPVFLASLLLGSVHFVFSHDYWFAPNRFAFMRGDTLVVNLMVGDELKPEIERPLQKEMTKRFVLITPHRTIDLLAELADSTFPVLTRKLDFEGLALLSMERDFWYTKMTDDDFQRALQYEEMQDIIALREKIGRKPEEHKRYDRSIKALLRVGKKMEGDLYKKALGHKVEIILLQNPFQLKPGDRLRIKVLDRGKPLANKLIKAYNRSGNGEVSKLKTYTDNKGEATFTLVRKGFWLIRVSHLWRCEDCEKVDWEHHYSTFSFTLE